MKKKDSYRQTFKELNRENKKVLMKMTQYLNTCALNQVVYKEVRVDIAAMLLENQKRGGTSEEVFGKDYKAFCNDLVKNSPHKTISEILLEFVMNFSLAFAVILPIFLLLETFFPSEGNRVDGWIIFCNWNLVVGMLVCGSLGGFGSLYIQRNAFSNKIKVFTIYFIGYMLIAIALMMWLSHLYNGFVSINVLVSTLILAALGMLAFALKRKIAYTRLENYKEL